MCGMDKAGKKLLRDLAKKAGNRTDVVVPVSEFTTETEARDESNPQHESHSETTYESRDLADRGLIILCGLSTSQDVSGFPIQDGHGLKITRAGVDLAEELRKTWLRRAIDKQPITFLLVVFGVAEVVAGFYLAYLFQANK